MIKFKDFLRVIDLDETTLKLVIEDGIKINDFIYETKTVKGMEDLSKYDDHGVGFIRPYNDEILIRLVKGDRQ